LRAIVKTKNFYNLIGNGQLDFWEINAAAAAAACERRTCPYAICSTGLINSSLALCVLVNPKTHVVPVVCLIKKDRCVCVEGKLVVAFVLLNIL